MLLHGTHCSYLHKREACFLSQILTLKFGHNLVSNNWDNVVLVVFVVVADVVVAVIFVVDAR